MIASFETGYATGLVSGVGGIGLTAGLISGAGLANGLTSGFISE